MNRENQHASISQLILDKIGADAHVLFGNVTLKTQPDVWARATIRSDRRQIGMPDLYRYFGIVSVQLFCKPDVGLGVLLALSTKLDELAGVTSDNIRFTESTFDPLMESDGWFNALWTIEFNHEE